MKTYRNLGAVGALLDEYEKSINELTKTIDPISIDDLVLIVDHKTDDEDCRSIQTILTHVVASGYGYAIYIQNHQGLDIPFREKESLRNCQKYSQSLYQMFKYTESVFQNFPKMILEEKAEERKIKTRWGQSYDVEQLMEHAIVHILRHRHQIERFLLKIEKN